MSTPSVPFLRFAPLYQTRVWGGRNLESQFHRTLPDETQPYGESWEIAAREEADSKVLAGPYGEKTLSELWADPESRKSIFGPKAPDSDRFPLLCKILDAKEKLSIQVHPPAEIAPSLGGEPKTETWYIAHAKPGAELYVGVEEGVTEEAFREALEKGTAEELVHAIPAKTGEHIFIPSGRLHAIGAGLVIYEIQQNSDTTYRVYDWGRIGLSGKPRDLHIEESLKSIDFDDVSPSMDEPDGTLLCECEHFRLERHSANVGENIASASGGSFSILTMVSGRITGGGDSLIPGDFVILPEGADVTSLVAEEESEFLLTTWP